ncbi:hypothetical protein [Aquiflexum sp.]|uniref:hypothetical protein n=1 Tax=Aquiflexum sp. TaxID=1872584 RepID=UPI0035939713
MENVINKDLLSHLLLLESDEQEKVLDFIKELIQKQVININALESEKAIESNQMKSFKDFNNDFELWREGKNNGLN